jgi:hypothetical protein
LPEALLDRFFMALSLGSVYAVVCLLFYFALEPFVRRTWPQMLIGWSRLAAGGWRDPLVGRSVLLGGAMFGLSALSLALIEPLHRALDLPPPTPVSGNWSVLASGRTMVGDLAIRLPAALFNALFFLMLLVLLRLLVRRTWLTYLLFGAGTVMFTMAQSVSWQIGLMVAVPIAVLWTVTLVRGGILAFAVGLFLWFLLSTLPLTLDVTQMYVTPSLLLIGAIVLLLAGALSTALGGRSLLAEELDRDR